MKNIAKLSILTLAVVILSGCAAIKKASNTVGGWVTAPASNSVTTTTNFVPVFQTNAVATTDPVSHLVTTNFLIVTNIVREIEDHTNVVYIAKPAITQGIAVAQEVTGFLPPPYGTAATAVLTGVSAVLAMMVRRKNGENNSLSDTVDKLSSTVDAVVKGVEKATVVNPSFTPVKIAIAEAAASAGVSDALHSRVLQNT